MLTSILHKRMQGVLKKEGVKVEEVVKAKAVAEGYRVSYRLRMEKNVTEQRLLAALKDCPLVRSSSLRPLKEGESCVLFWKRFLKINR